MSDDKQAAADYLKSYLSERNRKVYCIVRKVSRSGMSRVLTFFVFGCVGDADRHPVAICLDSRIANVLGMSLVDDGIRVHGGGMDMGFHLLDSLKHKLSLPKSFNCQPEYL